jgi:hypothetical protein
MLNLYVTTDVTQQVIILRLMTDIQNQSLFILILCLWIYMKSLLILISCINVINIKYNDLFCSSGL